jgi:hypothetical protein
MPGLVDLEPGEPLSLLMEWSGRAPAPPARNAGMGRASNGEPPCPTNQSGTLPPWAWQEFVPRRRPRSTRRDSAAAEVVTRPDRSTARCNAAVRDRYRGLCRRTSPERQAARGTVTMRD